ncbi:MAG: phosphoribosylamine--glycine ligase [Candidatus Eisenbacteria bacterium]
MRFLVVGSGGREHALGWKIAEERRDDEIYFLPGNGGTSEIGKNVDIAPTDFDRVLSFAADVSPDLVIVGPEDPLALGIVDKLEEAGLTVFGPTAQGARIEASKAFAKELMTRYSIPTAPFRVFTSEPEAHRYIDKSSKRLVIKADGLARGKGAIIPADSEEAHSAVEMIMGKKTFGDAGDTVVIEERLTGEEASVLAVTDGEHYVILPPSQDHKPIHDRDHGPNTGGMGAYCPAPVVDREALDYIENNIIRRVLRGLEKEGITYRGVIYAGLMLNDEGIFVIEFNARFGDPEIQSILPAIDINLSDLLLRASQGRLERTECVTASRWAVSVVMASGGYPGSYATGKEITGLGEALSREDVVVFHAGTNRQDDGGLITSGGRVLAVTGSGSTLREARRKTYHACRAVNFEGAHMRSDIGLKGLRRLEKAGVIEC